MWINGEDRMPPYGETVMYKYVSHKKIHEGIAYLEKTDGSGHHFNIIAEVSHNGKEKQPYISMLDGKSFLIPSEGENYLVWYDMIALNEKGLQDAQLIEQKMKNKLQKLWLSNWAN